MNSDPTCYNPLYTTYDSQRVLPTTAASDITTLTNFASNPEAYTASAVNYGDIYRLPGLVSGLIGFFDEVLGLPNFDVLQNQKIFVKQPHNLKKN